MTRIRTRFEQLKQQQRKALVPFITAGDPAPTETVGLMHKLVEAGADLLELGVPFSDPMADGPVIQRSSERALKHHVSLRDVMAMVKAFREQDNDTPVILMGYLNPIESLGYETFISEAVSAGVDGVLTVDLPPEESHELIAGARELGLDPVYLIAPTTTEERIDSICSVASGFVYYVSLKGVTGSNQLTVGGLEERLKTIRQHTDMPVGIGFGISDAEMASQVARIADAVVVGSALVSRIEQHAADPDKMLREAYTFISGLRTAIDAG